MGCGASAMAVKELHIRNHRTGNVRVVDYHVQHPDDGPLTRGMHDNNKPQPQQVLAPGEDEEIVEERLHIARE